MASRGKNARNGEYGKPRMHKYSLTTSSHTMVRYTRTTETCVRALMGLANSAYCLQQISRHFKQSKGVHSVSKAVCHKSATS